MIPALPLPFVSVTRFTLAVEAVMLCPSRCLVGPARARWQCDLYCAAILDTDTLQRKVMITQSRGKSILATPSGLSCLRDRETHCVSVGSSHCSRNDKALAQYRRPQVLSQLRYGRALALALRRSDAGESVRIPPPLHQSRTESPPPGPRRHPRLGSLIEVTIVGSQSGIGCQTSIVRCRSPP